MAPALSPGQPVPLDRPALNQPSGALPSRFTKVEQTIADVDPLRTSIRSLQTDLRHPTDFRDVFQIRGSAHEAGHWGVANPTGGDLFARVHGAVTAVFPQSIYVAAEKGGVIPLVPPGTVFFIGDLPWERFGAGPMLLPSPDRVDSRVDMRAGAPSAPLQATEIENPVPTIPTIGDGSSRGADESKADRPAAPPPHSASIMTDERLRRRTVRDLIMKAAQPAPKAEAAPAAAPKDVPAAPDATEAEKKTAPEKPERR
jgi:hypothetical protein